ncbi:MAG: 1-acyl-sn-glycerol-3-phosphate acyltransferase [Hyphomicrobiales bacterium]|nr:1-acyl-sn-glycerol-3-phosphate acyltransferase [Hyphomicrobiales bacterium]
MIAARSHLFTLSAVLWTAVMCALFLPLLVFPRRAMQVAAKLWAGGILVLARVVCGLGSSVRGRDNLPSGPVVIASKHQSMWETLIFHLLCIDPVYVLKKELLSLPFVGWYLRKAGNVAIDRSAGFRALKAMLPAVESRLKEGAQIIVFPEGTRGAPGSRLPYHPGIAAIYTRAGVPIVPVALNSGLFWGRGRILRCPGVITIEFLPPLPSGLDRSDFLRELQTQIEQATDRLIKEADPDAFKPPAASSNETDALGTTSIHRR